jgi:hypothetical protein
MLFFCERSMNKLLQLFASDDLTSYWARFSLVWLFVWHCFPGNKSTLYVHYWPFSAPSRPAENDPLLPSARKQGVLVQLNPLRYAGHASYCLPCHVSGTVFPRQAAARQPSPAYSPEGKCRRPQRFSLVIFEPCNPSPAIKPF